MTHRRLPAEWEKQGGIMLTWPHSYGDWGPQLAEVENTFSIIAVQISLREPVLIICADDIHQAHISRILNDAKANPENLRFAIAPSNDTWARDHGPIGVLDNNNPVLLDFIFNAWGNKFPSELDNKITNQLQSKHIFGNTRIESVNFVLEGGSIESDGRGTLLGTTSCLLNPSRNPGLDRNKIEKFLAEQLGINRVLWLNNGGLVGDDTDGHIDTLARFCDVNTIAYVSCDDANDEHYTTLKAMKEELSAFQNKDNNPYRLVPLPLPSAKYNSHGKRLPATYANFLIINDTILVPTYNDAKDVEALNTLQKCFPNREIVGIDCCALIQQFGSLHCVTMQLPPDVLQ